MTILAAHAHSVRSNSPTPGGWREALRQSWRDKRQLLQQLELPFEAEMASEVRGALEVGQEGGADAFPLFAPPGFVARMRKQDPRDPLLRQILPLEEEGKVAAGFVSDPVGDGEARLAPGLLQKYRGRALLITTGACAVHCRYCFRRHFPYAEGPRSFEAWRPALERIAADATLEEVILSGGDPLTLVDSHLAELAEGIASIPHVRRLRIHTRLPTMIPERVNGELLAWLRGTRLTPIVVVHVNHPREFGPEANDPAARALGQLVSAGIPVLNQAVLLAGVNDNVEVLEELCRSLVNLRVLPYYLHQLDPVAGAAHFYVAPERGRALVRELRARLPGYAAPRYVREVAGAVSKIPLEFSEANDD